MGCKNDRVAKRELIPIWKSDWNWKAKDDLLRIGEKTEDLEQADKYCRLFLPGPRDHT